ncbi:GSCOCG00008068001-RA-CDS [Cotesia congregata]|nr:GSCOCG00008068001-RA-CDS [Cotesia congregata]
MNGSLSGHRGPEQHPTRFADYFVICGLDKDSGLEPDKYFGDSLQSTPLDRAYKSKVLGHYPDSVPWNPFDEHAVCMQRTKWDSSSQPYLHAARTFLTNLYKCVPRHPGPGLSLESYVYNLLYNVPVPLPGKSLKFFVPNDEPAKSPLELVILYPCPATELPLLDYPIRDMFMWLGPETVIQLFTCVLLENQVLVRSTDFHKLMVVAECITALLFPFSWQHVYVPILPASLHHFLDAPVPFIMGLHAQSEGSNLKIASEANLCYVDIDKQTSQFPEELPIFPRKMQFLAEIKTLLNKYKVPHSEKTDNMVINYLNSDIMTSSLTLPGSGFHVPRRKHSLHDVLDWDNKLDTNNSTTTVAQSDALQRIVDIVKKTGISLDDIDAVENMTKDEVILTPKEEYQQTLIFNNAIREIFFNRFVQLFAGYDHFVIHPNEWLNNRDSMHVFDKATFLSDQPAQHLPFLSRFIETQMFASLVDTKVMSSWNELDSNIKVFDQRIAQIKKKGGDGMIRSTRYQVSNNIPETEKSLINKLTNIDFEASPPTEILPHRAAYFRSFPLLDTVALNKEPVQSSRKGQTQWKYKMKSLEANGKPPTPQETQSPRPQTKLSADMSPALIAQANWTFVEKLLKLLVTEPNLCLCDLLERVWSHGLQNKQGKSALWSHLSMYQELEECNDSAKSIDPNFLSPALAWCVLRKRLDYQKPSNKSFTLKDRLLSSIKTRNIYEIASYIKENFNDLSNLALETDVSPTRGTADRNRSTGERKSIGPEHLRPLPDSLTFDIRNVQAMTEIKTHIGYARAWVRLALEKKLLSRHLKVLLSNTTLLRNQYKRSAFLRCEEEKEQFLYHLLTLNAVDYFCFTNNYPTTKLPYRVIIFPSRKASAATTSANGWIVISGTLCETNPVGIPKGTLEFVFHHKNLGVLSTLRIGHDNSGISPKWMVEHVVVRNEVTGHTFKFPCGRWLGRGIDDGSTERLLVGALVPRSIDSDELVETCSTPPRCRSPSIPRNRPSLSADVLQHVLGEAVNAIVKFHYRRDPQDGSLTALLCGEGGLRIFGRNFYVWDYFLRVKENFEMSLLEEMDEYSKRLNRDRRLHAENNQRFTIFRCYCHLIDQINTFSHTLGKDGKFQLFICLAARVYNYCYYYFREQLLHPMLRPMSDARSTAEMYEETSFLRNPTLLNFLIHILEPLSEFHIVLEKSLTHGISSIC